jgi:hypothetical protein
VGRDAPKKATPFFAALAEVMSARIEEGRSDYPVVVPCRVPGVSRSGYYARRNRPLGDAANRRETPAARIQEVHAGMKGRYGRPRPASAGATPWPGAPSAA